MALPRATTPIAVVLLMSAWTGWLGCRRGSAPPTRRFEGSCEAVCSYYLSCRGPNAHKSAPQCNRECREIFSEDGDFDEEALQSIQRLSCQKIVYYIEGAPTPQR